MDGQRCDRNGSLAAEIRSYVGLAHRSHAGAGSGAQGVLLERLRVVVEALGGWGRAGSGWR